MSVRTSRGSLCIGPDVRQSFWFGERSSMQLDRGPYTSPTDVLLSPANKEIAWLRAYGQPRLPRERAFREIIDYQDSAPESHIQALEQYMEIAPFLVPKEKDQQRPLLRHPDLSPNNILVGADFQISGPIDWQHSSILPAFLAAGIPAYFANYDDIESLQCIPPQRSDDLNNMSAQERVDAEENFRRRHLHFYYVGFTQKFNEPHYKCLIQPISLLKRRIYNHASEPWEGDNITLQADLLEIRDHWQEVQEQCGLPTPICPISFKDEQKMLRLAVSQYDTLRELERIQNFLQISSEGWTTSEQYEESIKRAKELRDEALASLETEHEKEMTCQHWPFDDHEEL